MSSQSDPSYPFDGPGLILAHAYYPYEFGEFGGDIHFDEDEAWAVNATDYSSGRMDFFTVAQHEIGAGTVVTNRLSTLVGAFSKYRSISKSLENTTVHYPPYSS